MIWAADETKSSGVRHQQEPPSRHYLVLFWAREKIMLECKLATSRAVAVFVEMLHYTKWNIGCTRHRALLL